MLDATSKALFHSLAQVRFLQRLVSRYGIREGLLLETARDEREPRTGLVGK